MSTYPEHEASKLSEILHIQDNAVDVAARIDVYACLFRFECVSRDLLVHQHFTLKLN